MFTQQHYEVLAKILRETRQNQTTLYSNNDISPEYLEGGQQALGDFQLRLMKHLLKDNPKFKELLFIGAASEHAPSKTKR